MLVAAAVVWEEEIDGDDGTMILVCGKDLGKVAMKAKICDKTGGCEVGLERSGELGRGVWGPCRGRWRR